MEKLDLYKISTHKGDSNLSDGHVYRDESNKRLLKTFFIVSDTCIVEDIKTFQVVVPFCSSLEM